MLFTIDFTVSDLMILESIFAVIVDAHKLSDILGRDWKEQPYDPREPGQYAYQLQVDNSPPLQIEPYIWVHHPSTVSLEVDFFNETSLGPLARLGSRCACSYISLVSSPELCGTQVS